MTKGCQLQQNRNKSSRGNLKYFTGFEGCKADERIDIATWVPWFYYCKGDVEKTSKSEFGISEDNNQSMFIPAWNLDTCSTCLLDFVASVGGWPLPLVSPCVGGAHVGPCATHGMWPGIVPLFNSVKSSNEGFPCTMRALGTCVGVHHLCLHRHKTHVQVVAALTPWVLPPVSSSPGLWLCSSSRVSRSCWRTAGNLFKGTVPSQRLAQSARIANLR